MSISKVSGAALSPPQSPVPRSPSPLSRNATSSALPANADAFDAFVQAGNPSHPDHAVWVERYSGSLRSPGKDSAGDSGSTHKMKTSTKYPHASSSRVRPALSNVDFPAPPNDTIRASPQKANGERSQALNSLTNAEEDHLESLSNSERRRRRRRKRDKGKEKAQAPPVPPPRTTSHAALNEPTSLSHIPEAQSESSTSRPGSQESVPVYATSLGSIPSPTMHVPARFIVQQGSNFSSPVMRSTQQDVLQVPQRSLQGGSLSTQSRTYTRASEDHLRGGLPLVRLGSGFHSSAASINSRRSIDFRLPEADTAKIRHDTKQSWRGIDAIMSPLRNAVGPRRSEKYVVAPSRDGRAPTPILRPSVDTGDHARGASPLPSPSATKLTFQSHVLNDELNTRNARPADLQSNDTPQADLQRKSSSTAQGNVPSIAGPASLVPFTERQADDARSSPDEDAQKPQSLRSKRRLRRKSTESSKSFKQDKQAALNSSIPSPGVLMDDGSSIGSDRERHGRQVSSRETGKRALGYQLYSKDDMEGRRSTLSRTHMSPSLQDQISAEDALSAMTPLHSTVDRHAMLSSLCSSQSAQHLGRYDDQKEFLNDSRNRMVRSGSVQNLGSVSPPKHKLTHSASVDEEMRSQFDSNSFFIPPSYSSRSFSDTFYLDPTPPTTAQSRSIDGSKSMPPTPLSPAFPTLSRQRSASRIKLNGVLSRMRREKTPSLANLPKSQSQSAAWDDAHHDEGQADLPKSQSANLAYDAGVGLGIEAPGDTASPDRKMPERRWRQRLHSFTSSKSPKAQQQPWSVPSNDIPPVPPAKDHDARRQLLYDVVDNSLNIPQNGTEKAMLSPTIHKSLSPALLTEDNHEADEVASFVGSEEAEQERRKDMDRGSWSALSHFELPPDKTYEASERANKLHSSSASHLLHRNETTDQYEENADPHVLPIAGLSMTTRRASRSDLSHSKVTNPPSALNLSHSTRNQKRTLTPPPPSSRRTEDAGDSFTLPHLEADQPESQAAILHRSPSLSHSGKHKGGESSNGESPIPGTKPRSSFAGDRDRSPVLHQAGWFDGMPPPSPSKNSAAASMRKIFGLKSPRSVSSSTFGHPAAAKPSMSGARNVSSPIMPSFTDTLAEGRPSMHIAGWSPNVGSDYDAARSTRENSPSVDRDGSESFMLMSSSSTVDRVPAVAGSFIMMGSSSSLSLQGSENSPQPGSVRQGVRRGTPVLGSSLSHSTSSLRDKAQVHPSPSINQSADLEAFDKMLRDSAKEDAARIRQIAARSTTTEDGTQTPVRTTFSSPQASPQVVSTSVL